MHIMRMMLDSCMKCGWNVSTLHLWKTTRLFQRWRIMNVNYVIVSYLPHDIMSIPKRHICGCNHVIPCNIRIGYWVRRSIYVVCVIGMWSENWIELFLLLRLKMTHMICDSLYVCELNCFYPCLWKWPSDVLILYDWLYCTVLFIDFIPIVNLLNSIVLWICCCRVIRYVVSPGLICGELSCDCNSFEHIRYALSYYWQYPTFTSMTIRYVHLPNGHQHCKEGVIYV